ncbi:hypothetical protein [Halobellus rubicundus]|uniref:DUF1684 domain-containing protein n=1 Tax=Halobellus rubicundus TaxID=2996466 RepID=A0ABD5MCG0_9EURY
MSDWSRRRFLAAASLPVVGSVAGCSESLDRTGAEPHFAEQKRPVTDYEREQVRNNEGASLIEDESAARRSYTYEHLTERANVPSFADVPEARQLEQFVDSTDFETESILLLVRPIPECYDLRLVSVSEEDDGVDSQYCRDMRPADVACERDAEDTVGVAIRLPFAGDSFNTLGMGFSSSCDNRPTVVSFEPVTPTNATGAATDAGGADE